MIKIKINGKLLEIADLTSVHDFLIQQQFCLDAIAVAINRQHILRSQYCDTVIKENDQVEVVTAMQGG